MSWQPTIGHPAAILVTPSDYLSHMADRFEDEALQHLRSLTGDQTSTSAMANSLQFAPL